MTGTFFFYELEEEGIFPSIDPDELDGDISFFGIKDNKVRSCVLFRSEGDDEIYNEFVYSDPVFNGDRHIF